MTKPEHWCRDCAPTVFIRVNDDGDWVEITFKGKVIHEGHRPNVVDLLRALGYRVVLTTDPV